MADLKQASKNNYSSRGEKATVEEINLASLQRIADAAEKMCLDREKLERDYQYMRKSRDAYRDQLERMARKYAAQKGIVTKLKKKLAAL